MTNLPTAEEYLNRDESGVFNKIDITQAMIGFAKIHVEAALKEASEKVIMLDTNEDCHIEDDEGNFPDLYVIDKTSILTAYPPDKIR